jgi:hypothetical protein
LSLQSQLSYVGAIQRMEAIYQVVSGDRSFTAHIRGGRTTDPGDAILDGVGRTLRGLRSLHEGTQLSFSKPDEALPQAVEHVRVSAAAGRSEAELGRPVLGGRAGPHNTHSANLTRRKRR